MRIVEPSYEILAISPDRPLEAIEAAGRTCYRSEDRITETSAVEFVRRLISRGHLSVVEHASMTVRFVVDRGFTHELVRHRLASFSQESTRYCNYAAGKHGGEIAVIRPSGLNEQTFGDWLTSAQFAEVGYFRLLAKGCPPQVSRSVLPNCLASQIVVTANMREWRVIFEQRTSDAAHPDMARTMRPLLVECRRRVPVLFDDVGEV